MTAIYTHLIPATASSAIADGDALAARLQAHRQNGTPVIGLQFAQPEQVTQDILYGDPLQLPDNLDLRDLVFIGCDFQGVIFPTTTNLNRTGFLCCQLDRAVFSTGLVFSGATFNGCSVYGTVFAGTTQHNISYRQCEGEHLDFHGAVLRESSITWCDIASSSFAGATIGTTRIRQTNLDECDLRATDLRTAEFHDVQCRGIAVDPSTQVPDTAREVIAAILRDAAQRATNAVNDQWDAATGADENAANESLAQQTSVAEASTLLTRRLEVVGLLLERESYCWRSFTQYARTRLQEDPERMRPLLQWIYDSLRPYDALRARLDRIGVPNLLIAPVPPASQ